MGLGSCGPLSPEWAASPSKRLDSHAVPSTRQARAPVAGCRIGGPTALVRKLLRECRWHPAAHHFAGVLVNRTVIFEDKYGYTRPPWRPGVPDGQSESVDPVAVEVSAFTVSGPTAVARVVEDDPAVALGALVLANSGRGWLRARVRAWRRPGVGPGGWHADTRDDQGRGHGRCHPQGCSADRHGRSLSVCVQMECPAHRGLGDLGVATDNDVFPAVRRVDGRRPEEYVFGATAIAPNTIP